MYVCMYDSLCLLSRSCSLSLFVAISNCFLFVSPTSCGMSLLPLLQSYPLPYITLFPIYGFRNILDFISGSAFCLKVFLCRHSVYVDTSVWFVIVISRFLKRYSKAKSTRAPAYSRVLRRIKGGFQKGLYVSFCVCAVPLFVCLFLYVFLCIFASSSQSIICSYICLCVCHYYCTSACVCLYICACMRVSLSVCLLVYLYVSFSVCLPISTLRCNYLAKVLHFLRNLIVSPRESPAFAKAIGHTIAVNQAVSSLPISPPLFHSPSLRE